MGIYVDKMIALIDAAIESGSCINVSPRALKEFRDEKAASYFEAEGVDVICDGDAKDDVELKRFVASEG